MIRLQCMCPYVKPACQNFPLNAPLPFRAVESGKSERETKMNAGDKRRISNRWRRRGTGKASFIQFFCLFVFKRLNGAQLNS